MKQKKADTIDFDGGRKAINENLSDCCREILRWHKTGSLPMDARVIGIAACYFNEDGYLTEAEVTKAAIEYIAEKSPTMRELAEKHGFKPISDEEFKQNVEEHCSKN